MSRQEAHAPRRARRRQVVEMLAQDVGGVAFDLDRSKTGAKGCDPGLDPLAARAQARAEPILHMSRRRWPVRPEIGLDRTHASVVEVRDASPTRVVIEALEGGLLPARGT